MKIDVREYPDGEVFTTLEDHVYFFKGHIHTIPAGYRSDGASVPRFFWRILSPRIDPQTLDPSVEHDFNYQFRIGTRLEADRHYLMRLLETGYPVWKSIITYYAVRIFGGSHYGCE